MNTQEIQRRHDLLLIERDAQAVLISDQQAEVERQTEISNNFAAQVRQQNETVVALKERCAALEKEVSRLQTVPMKYRRMEFNAQLQTENASLRNRLSILDGLSEVAIDGGWTYRGMESYAKNLEQKCDDLRIAKDQAEFTVLKTMLEVFDIMGNATQFRSALGQAVAKRTDINVHAKTEKEK